MADAGPVGERGRRVRNKTTGRVGEELTPYGHFRYELRLVLWDGDDEPTLCGISVLTDEHSGRSGERRGG